jgi:DNA-binding IclR family transcriptional regulator
MLDPMGEKESLSSAVGRAFDILEAIGRSASGLSNSDLSRTLKIPKSSASYILRTMEQRGYLRRDRSSGKYKLGFKFLILSRGALAGMDLKETALPVLRELTDRTSFTSNLAILDGHEVVYIEKAVAPGFIQMDTWVGRRLPAHATSVGKALLAFLPEKELETLLKGVSLERRTPKTIGAYSRLVRELEIVRRQGYSVDDEESSKGVCCIGAPVFGGFGRVEAAISVSGIKEQVNEMGLRKVANRVIEAAKKISEQIQAS